MQIYRRLLLTVALSTFITACGGTESDPGNLAETTSEARGGKKGGGGGTTPTPTPTHASVTAAHTVFDGYTTVKHYAGSWTKKQLWPASPGTPSRAITSSGSSAPSGRASTPGAPRRAT